MNDRAAHLLSRTATTDTGCMGFTGTRPIAYDHNRRPSRACLSIDRGADGRPLTKTAQVRMCGNSVCPPIAAALVRANYQERQGMEVAA